MLKTDVRMRQEIYLVICGLEELARHGAGRQQAAVATGGSTAHDHQHGAGLTRPATGSLTRDSLGPRYRVGCPRLDPRARHGLWHLVILWWHMPDPSTLTQSVEAA